MRNIKINLEAAYGIGWRAKCPELNLMVQTEKKDDASTLILTEIVNSLGNRDFAITDVVETPLVPHITDTGRNHYWCVYPREFDLGVRALVDGFATSRGAAEVAAQDAIWRIDEVREDVHG